MPIKRSLAIALVLALGVQLAPRSARAATPEVKACLAALEGSYSLAKQQRLIEQRGQLLLCSAAQCPSDVRADCAKKVEEVNQAIPTVIFHVTDSAGNDLSTVRVTMDGALFASQLTGASVPLNPGKHRFVFEVEGQAPVKKEFVILTAQKDRVEDIVVGAPQQLPAAVHGPQPNGTQSAGQVPVAESPARSPESSHGSTQKTWAVISGAVGVVGMGIGTAMAVSAKHMASNAACDANNVCSPAGVDDRRAAIHLANWAMLPAGIGLVGVATGLTLWFTKPSNANSQRPTASLSVSPNEIAVSGRF